MVLNFRNLDEQMFVYNNVTSRKETWTGANDRASEGHWVWDSDRSSMNAVWAAGEPNNVGNNEDCGTVGHLAEKMNDFPCHGKLHVACQTAK